MLRYRNASLILLFLLIAAFFISVCVGAESLNMLLQQDDWSFIWDLRIPRTLTAIGAGAAIAISGVLSQALFRNALATPSILGTEAGAGFGLAVCAASFGLYANQSLVMVSTVMGGAAATAIALTFARGPQPLIRLLLGGFALNAFLAAGTAMITSWLMESGQGMNIYHWLLGSFSARSWDHVILIFLAVVIAGRASMAVATKLDMLALGDEAAITSGINLPSLRRLTFILIAVLVGTSMSVGGALPFVGLIVPHFIRMQTGPHIRPLILNSAMGGAILALLADVAARTLRAPVELDVGLLTTLLGAPYFLWLLKRETSTQ